MILLRYAIGRFFTMLLTLWIVSVLVFAIINLPPGDYLSNQIAELRATGQAEGVAKAEFLRTEYALDRPLWEQYMIWAGFMPPLICASIRDILAPPSKAKKAAFADDTIAEFYDTVLVHSDPALTPLETSWPVSDALHPMLCYTGFVAPAAAGAHPKAAGSAEIIVSAGGGDVGAPVYAAAIAAASQMEQTFRILVGGTDPQARIGALRKLAPPNVIVESARPDFRQMLHHATASVSLCGYNTALDILQVGTPAVFIPFDEGGEVEQGLRANALAVKDAIEVVARADLTAQTLCTALKAVIMAPRRDTGTGQFDGAAQTVKVTHAMRLQT